MGLVRSVFTKSRSVQRQASHGRNNAVEKKKWRSSVRSYLCGDEYNSLLAAEDSASVRSLNFEEVDLVSFSSKGATNVGTGGRGSGDIASVYGAEETASVRSSEATVNQPVDVDSKDEIRKEKQNSAYKLFQQDDAALVIQSAFRSFQARRARNEIKMEDDKINIESKGSPSRESIATSVEVQTGNSSDIFSFQEESSYACHQMRHKTRSQVLKLQEDWDDSTVSSVISKMRIQNRLEAATRRERALAYAFSQQLRICSKKKQSATNSNESNVGWNWLERWMAARHPEIILMEDQISSNQTTADRKRLMLDGAVEEKESCGSNEVSSLVEVSFVSVAKNVPRPMKSRSKVTRSLSRQNSATSHLCPGESKDLKKVCHAEDNKKKRKRAKHPGNNRIQLSVELEAQH